MNRDLYIHTLQGMKDVFAAEHMDTQVEALEAAIHELERPTDGDCISRQAAIDMTFTNGINEDGALYVPWREVKKNLEKLPSAQPEPQWIPCSECVNYIDERCVVANHHVSEKENCMEVFGAKRRTVER